MQLQGKQKCVSQRLTHARLSCRYVRPEDDQQVVSSNVGDSMPKQSPSGGGASLKSTQTASLKTHPWHTFTHDFMTDGVHT